MRTHCFPRCFHNLKCLLAGRIICVERTVLLLQKPLLCVASGAASCELMDPVMLDELDSLTPVNSICSVQGGQHLFGNAFCAFLSIMLFYIWLLV